MKKSISKKQKLKMKIIILFVLYFVGHAAAQSATCVADFSLMKTILANLNSTFQVANNFTTPKLPLSVLEVSVNRTDIGTLNQMAVQWSYAITNVTQIFQQIFANLSLAVKDNKTDDYTKVFDDIITMMAAAIDTSGSSPLLAGLSAIPVYAQTAFQYLIGNFTNQFNSTGILITSAEAQSQILINSNVALTPGNASNYLMAPAVVNLFLTSLNNLTLNYMVFISNVTRDMNNTYSIFKSSDAILNDIQTNYTASMSNATTLANKINMTVYNGTLRTLASMNSSIASFISSVNSAVSSNGDFAANMTALKMLMGSIATFLNDNMLAMMMIDYTSYLSTLNSTLATYFISATYQYPSPARSLILQAFNMTGRTNCSNNLVNNATSAYIGFGGAKAFFNCTAYEQITLNETQILVDQTMTAIMLDFNTSMALLSECNTLKPTYVPNGKNLSVVECATQAVSGFTGYDNFIINELSTMIGQIRGFLVDSQTRFTYCFMAHNMNVNYTSSYLTQTFLNCSNLTMPSDIIDVSRH